MSESYSRRSWKGIAIAFLVIAAVAAIVALIVIYSGSESQKHEASIFSLDDVISGVYSPKRFPAAQWLSEDEFWYMSGSNVWTFSVSNNKSDLIANSSLWEYVPDSFWPSPSGKYVLYSFNKTMIFRYSYNASFQVRPRNDQSGESATSIFGGAIIQFASWGPDDQLVFVHQNNIYYMANYTSDPVNVTRDGVPGVVYNGVPDWVYEEEVLGSGSALWWSPDGKHFAFLKFNDVPVHDMYYMEYGSVKQDYPTVVDIKYPKPGSANPEVSVWMVATAHPEKLIPVQPTDEKLNGSEYVTSVDWAKDDTLSVTWEPRTQNVSRLSLCSSQGESWTCKVDSEEVSSGWIDVKSPLFSQNGSYFLIKSDQTGFKHLTRTVEGKSEFLTNGSYEVTSIEYYDEHNSTVYFVCTVEMHAERREFRSLHIPSRRSSCLSCGAPNCNFVSVSVGKGGKYYARVCSDLETVPDVKIIDLQSNETILTWQDNHELKEKLAKERLPKHIDYEIPVAGNQTLMIKIRVHVPADFKNTRKYPAIINVYGGPGNQKITDAFGIDWGSYLVNVRNYLYVEVDGRGSPYRGDDLLYQVYKRLGTAEIEDQIAAMKYLTQNESFVDPKRTAIWGWSYGGYAAAMSLAKGSSVFKCAMSVAPVTSWTFYDSIYTERYMLTPEQNPDGYRSSQLMNYVSSFKNHSFLLLHGTADDNVHLQQSMILTKALNNASVIFDMHLYPDENHSIPKSVLHVYTTLQDFLDSCFA